MCLATIYGKKQEDETILLKNASRIDVDGTTIRIRDIMGMEITVEGAITMVDLANSIGKDQLVQTIELHERLQQSGCVYSLIVSADSYLDPEHAWMTRFCL